MVCVAVQRQLTAVWLNLTGMLVVQLDPPSLIPIKPTPSNDSQQLVMQVVPVIVQLSLTFLSQREAMESVSFLEELSECVGLRLVRSPDRIRILSWPFFNA